MAETTFTARVAIAVKGSESTDEASERLMRLFPRLVAVSVERRGPGHFGIHIRRDGDPNKPIVEIVCNR